MINVCFEQTGFETEKAWARAAVTNAWEADSLVAFTGWKLCSQTSNRDLRVQFIDDTGNVEGLGIELDNVQNGVQLDSWSRGVCSLGTRERCVRSTAVHEFGHALGFAHERNRSDTPAEYQGMCETQGSNGNVAFGSWDLHSVMNYCNPVRNGDGILSPTDISGLQWFYGAPKTASVISRGVNQLEVYGRRGDVVYSRVWDGSSWSAWAAGGSAPVLTSSAVAVTWGGTRVDIFGRGSDGSLMHGWRTVTGTLPSWESLGGQIAGPPVAVSVAPGRLDVFARGTDRALWHRSFTQGVGWTIWQSRGGVIVGTPVAVSGGPNPIDVFARGTDQQLHHMFGDGQTFFWEPLGGVLLSSPAAVAWGGNRLDVVVRGTDNGLHHLSWNGTSWLSWMPVGGGPFQADPDIVSWGPNRLDVFARGHDYNIHHNWWDGTTWNTWQSLGGDPEDSADSPDAISWGPNRIDVFTGYGSHFYTNGSHWEVDDIWSLFQ